VFDSYVDAAVVCFQAGLITAAGLRAVVDGATRELAAVTFTDERQPVMRLHEYQTAVRRAQHALEAAETAAEAAAAKAAAAATAGHSSSGTAGGELQ
jgi:hypothetical protein